MADVRDLTFGVQWDVDNSPLDETDALLDQLEDSAGQAYDGVEQIGTAIQHIGTNAGSAFSGVEGASQSMGAAVRGAMEQSIAAGNGLGRTLLSGVGAAFENVRAKAQGFGAATKSVVKDIGNAFLHPIQTIKNTLGAALEKAGSNTKELGSKAKETGKDLDEMGSKGTDATNKMDGGFKKLVTSIGAMMIIKKVVSAIKEFMGAAISAAANAEETQSKFDTVFKGAAEGADQWVDNFAGAAKRSKNEVRGFMADSGAIFAGIGMTEDAAASMSQMMTSLTYDLASFNNLADADAFAKLRSGLMGETEGLKSMGIVLNETALKQSMMDMGIKGTFQKLDEATKVQVRFNAILGQTADAQQDVTRTADSYTNSVKGVKGIWADFLANAGAKFTPVLTNMFNAIADKWPTIEPMLMQVVDVLAVGLETAVPVLMQLGSTLLPIFAQGLGVVLQIITPLIPIIGMFAQTVMPPLVSVISMLAQTLLPPIISILGVLMQLLQPLMPVLQVVAQAILPPIAQLLGYIAPVLQALSPVLQFIGTVVGVIAEVLGKVIGFAADGVGKVVNFFTSLFGGTKEANAEMGALADNTAAVMGAGSNIAMGAPSIATPEIPAFTMPEIPAPDPSAYTNTISAAMDTAPIMATESWGAATDTARAGLDEIGGAAIDVYAGMATQAEDAWTRTKDAAADGVRFIIEQFSALSLAAGRIGTINISTSGVSTIPHNATGDSDYPGGPTYINDGPGGHGEIVELPNHSRIIPADQSSRLVSGGKGGKSITIAPQISIQLSGSATEEDKAALLAVLGPELKRICKEAAQELKDDDTRMEALQEALA